MLELKDFLESCTVIRSTFNIEHADTDCIEVKNRFFEVKIMYIKDRSIWGVIITRSLHGFSFKSKNMIDAFLDSI